MHAILWQAGGLLLRVGDLLAIAEELGWLAGDRQWMARCDRQRERTPPDDDAIQRASEDFRYERDLLTAEETERWLEARNLTLVDFQDHCERLAMALPWSGGVDADAHDDPGEGDAPDQDAWRVHLWLTDRLGLLARRCAWLLLAARDAGECWPETVPGPDVWRRWEDLLRQQREVMLADERACRLLELQRLALARIVVEVADFADEAMVREAELCLNEGSATMDDIAAATDVAVEQMDCLVRDLPEPWQDLLAALPVGSVRRWIAPDEPPRLLRILSRRDPTLEDATVRRVIGDRLQEDHYGAREKEHISWQHPLLRL